MDTMTKLEARARFKALRDGVEAEERRAMDHAICEAVIASDTFARAQTVFLYYPIASEVDARPIAKAAWKAGKRVAFPRITGGASMEWHYTESFDELAVSEHARLVIPEPSADPATLILLTPSENGVFNLDLLLPLLVIVPALAYDEQRYRLGYGGGYYDAFLSLLAENPGVTTLGVAYPSCIVESLGNMGLRELHDRPVDILISTKTKRSK